MMNTIKRGLAGLLVLLFGVNMATPAFAGTATGWFPSSNTTVVVNLDCVPTVWDGTRYVLTDGTSSVTGTASINGPGTQQVTITFPNYSALNQNSLLLSYDNSSWATRCGASNPVDSFSLLAPLFSNPNGTHPCMTGSTQTGTFTVTNLVVVSHANCAGHANIPPGVTRISSDSSPFGFKNATLLTSVTIPNTVTTIGAQAFAGATGLTAVTIPNTVTTIRDQAFEGATGLTSIAIPNSVTSIGIRAFRSTTSLSSITLPNSITTIAEGLFSSNTALTSITIPNSVTSIGDNAFLGTRGLTAITIPSSVTSIGFFAFQSAMALSTVTFLGPPPATVDSSAFLSLPAGARAVVSSAHIGSGAGKYGNVGSTWNGLRVSLPTSTLSLNSAGTVTTQVLEETFTPTNPQLTRSGFTLAGWSATQGSAATFAADLSDFTMGPTAQTLFAVWEEIPVEVPSSSAATASEEVAHPFSGPLLRKVDRRTFSAGEASSITFEGKRLNRIHSVKLDGIELEVISKSRDQITLTIPAMQSGSYTIVIESKSGKLTLTPFIVVN